MSAAGAYLTANGDVKKLLADAVAKVAREQPRDPVDAIGKFLLAGGKARKQAQMAQRRQESLDAEEQRKIEKPILASEKAIALALDLFGLAAEAGSIKDLDSYDDRNFYLRATHTRPELAQAADAHAAAGGAYHFTFKVHNGVESLDPGFIEAQNLAMDKVRAAGVWCPRALPSVSGEPIAFAPLPLANGTVRKHAIRCLPFKPAGLMGGVVVTTPLLRELGAVTAGVSAALSKFDHPATHRTFMWDLALTLAVRPLLEYLSEERRSLVGSVLDEFERRVEPRADALPQCVIHGDINDQNVLVAPDTEDPKAPSGSASSSMVVGVIDFGDMCYTWRVNEVAIAAAYAVIALHYERPKGAPPPSELPSPSEVDACNAMVATYAAKMESLGMPLTPTEWHVLPTLIASRIAMSLSIGAYSSAQDPTNEYLKLTLLPGLAALKNLRQTTADELMKVLQAGAAVELAKQGA